MNRRHRGAFAGALCSTLLGSALVGGLTTTADASPGKRGQTYYVPVTKSLTVLGKGYGHGSGMSQHGAQGAALAGKRHREILRFYYPGTTFGSNKGLVRVLLSADSTSDVAVRPAKGLRVRDLGSDTALTVPEYDRATQWRLRPQRKQRRRTVVQYENARGWHTWRTLSGDGQFAADVPLALVLPDGSTTRYRGLLRAASPYDGAGVRDTVNVLPMDDYVRGVIADEMPASWHQQALRSQAVAARTYASFAQRAASDRYWQICDTTACQVYGGVGAEAATTNRAVRKTSGRILMDGTAPAFTQFSASSGGWTADGGQDYLPAQRDPWDDWSGNDNHAWSTKISVASLESAFGRLGSLESIAVTRRDGHGAWGGRVQQIVLRGSADTVALTGDDLRWRYGLRSSWFSFAPTPIIKEWRRLGGRRSPFGRPASSEVAVDGVDRPGARQLFADGRAFWTRAGGAAALRGQVLARYRRLGGPTSAYGFPTDSPAATADDRGSKTPLEHGMIFSSKRTGAHALQGRVLIAYRKKHLTGGRLGYPLSGVVRRDRTQRARFQGGTITYDERTGDVTVEIG